MNVLYQSERLTQFKIADLQQQAIDAENIRLARASGLDSTRGIVPLIRRTFVSLMHLSPPRMRLGAPSPMPPVTSPDALCLPGAEC